jgi:hypothetical protein
VEDSGQTSAGTKVQREEVSQSSYSGAAFVHSGERVEEFNFTTSLKSAASEVRSQDDADFFFLYANDIVHSEFVPNRRTVNRTFYLKVLKRLRDAMRRKRPELWQSGEWWLHHDNVPVHKALSAKKFLTKNGMTHLIHPPYSLDLAPCEFFLFPRMKKSPQRKSFCGRGRVEDKNDGGIKRHHFARVSGLLRKV